VERDRTHEVIAGCASSQQPSGGQLVQLLGEFDAAQVIVVIHAQLDGPAA
jgi:hypothetical protein